MERTREMKIGFRNINFTERHLLFIDPEPKIKLDY